ncbi:serine carboxypeptidase [Mycena floridula]|nr:serine carboxypeptidase [Mycena floridula]
MKLSFLSQPPIISFLQYSPIITLFLFPSIAAASEIPVLDGILGGATINKTTLDRLAASAAVKRPVESLLAASASVNTPGKLRIKAENSGVCETTPGVYSASGYGDITATDSLWFWYFDARNNPDTAPLTLWLNGGPGSSSLIGAIQELGPCRINNDSTTVSPNPFSWNNNSNILFIDSPFGVGYSLTNNLTAIGTSKQTAVYIWQFLQIFLSDPTFEHLKTRDFALWTESYGGHYGPIIANYFLTQNVAIASGTVSGIPLNLKVLGIGDGMTDALAQYPGYIEYAASNPYHPLVASSVIATANATWSAVGGCKEQIMDCYNAGDDSVCSAAQSYCNSRILSPLVGIYNPYYVQSLLSDVEYPPDFTDYLASVQTTIGAEKTWAESNIFVYLTFAASGDWMRNARQDLETVITAGVRTIIYAGDADYICNYIGIEAMVDALVTPLSKTYQAQTFQNYTVRGQLAGLYKNAGSFSYLRLLESGHEVPAYTIGDLDYGEAALQMFEQVMAYQSLEAT